MSMSTETIVITATIVHTITSIQQWIWPGQGWLGTLVD